MVEEGLRQGPYGVPRAVHLPGEEAVADEEVVVDDVAARALDGADEAERRLLAEGADHDDPGVVAGTAAVLVAHVEVGLRHRHELFERHDLAGAKELVQLVGRHVVRLVAALGVELPHQGAAAVPVADALAELILGDRGAAELAHVVHQLTELVRPEVAADALGEVLGEIDVAAVLLGVHHLPHAGEVPDHVAGAREERAGEEVEPAGDGQLHHAPGEVADVGLVVGVAADDVDPVAAAVDAHGEHAGRVDDLGGCVHGEEAYGLSARLLGEPTAGRRELQIEVVRLGPGDDFCSVHGVLNGGSRSGDASG